jgi:hypothetical protein
MNFQQKLWNMPTLGSICRKFFTGALFFQKCRLLARVLSSDFWSQISEILQDKLAMNKSRLFTFDVNLSEISQSFISVV